MKHYIYIAIDTNTREVLYIGKGKDNRYLHIKSGISHVYEANELHHLGLDKNLEVGITVRGLSDRGSCELEKLLIHLVSPKWNIDYKNITPDIKDTDVWRKAISLSDLIGQWKSGEVSHTALFNVNLSESSNSCFDPMFISKIMLDIVGKMICHTLDMESALNLFKASCNTDDISFARMKNMKFYNQQDIFNKINSEFPELLLEWDNKNIPYQTLMIRGSTVRQYIQELCKLLQLDKTLDRKHSNELELNDKLARLTLLDTHKSIQLEALQVQPSISGSFIGLTRKVKMEKALELKSEGMTYVEVARLLCVSVRTVKYWCKELKAL